MQDIVWKSLNSVDYIVLTIIIFSLIFGFFRGFIASILSFTGWVLSIILAYKFFPQAETILSKFFSSKLVIIAFGYASLLLLSLIIFGIINMIILAFCISFKKSFLDRSMGLVFGLFRGGIIVSFLFLCFNMSICMLSGADDEEKDTHLPNWLTKAQTFKLLQFGSNALENFIPKTFKKQFQSVYDDISESKIDDRFLENSIEKLSAYATDNEIRTINLKRHELSITESEEMVDIHTLKMLLDLYKDKGKKGLIKNPEITSKEIKRLNNIVNRKLKD